MSEYKTSEQIKGYNALLILIECDCCGTETEEEDAHIVSDGKVCLHCLDNDYTECDCCSEYILTGDLHDVCGGVICESCLDNELLG
ncbi:hypothetical protein LCGC14_3149650 [marine sediment metagenome]|uniref:Uncharacterized protein n=1 Tax=marine sediment metagenome TaxID=412755 RepID=A0A0F8VUK3_9ZZZZ